jgi:hypothetical protein
MRKLIILAISLVALAAIAVPFANAATVDANGVVTVTKGDVQKAMDWNNDQFQANLDGIPSLITGTSSVTGPNADWNNMIPSPVTGEWHDYSYSNVTGGINKPEDCQWSTAWGFEADVWEPTKATVTAVAIRNTQNKITGWTVTSTGYSTTRSNHVWCDMGGTMGGYDRTTTEYFNGGSLASVQVNGKNVPLTPAV